MNYWLVKSEPFVYSYDDLIAEGTTMWDGVRNYAARNHMRDMKLGDYVLYYHSRKGLEVVAITKVIKEHYPDPTAKEGDWSVVDIEPYKRFEKPVTLKQIKAEESLQEIALVRIGRLSVMPIDKKAFFKILKMGETEL